MLQSTSEPQGFGEESKKALVRRQAAELEVAGDCRVASDLFLVYHLLDPSVVPYVTKTEKKLSAGKRWGNFWRVQLLARNMGEVLGVLSAAASISRRSQTAQIARECVFKPVNL